HDLACIIHNADARFLDRQVESSKIVHAALLLLMLEAAMRTSFHHQPEAQHPNSSAIHKLVGRLPHLLGVKRTCCERRGRGNPTLITLRTLAALKSRSAAVSWRRGNLFGR